MTAKRAVFIHSAELEKYTYPSECPFRPERARLTREKLLSMGIFRGRDRGEAAPQPADRPTLLGFHSAMYVDALEAASGGQLDVEAFGMGLGTEDCPVFPGMYEYAVLACGASLEAARLLLAGEARATFNPSGGYHHAHASHAGGFCYLNDVVLACMELVSAGKRVLFLDIDVHHCDGVQGAFYDSRDVLTLSFHQDPKTIFPGTGATDEIGEGDGRGYTVNVPLPVSLHDEAFLKAFRAVAVPVIDAYGPDVIVLELGMDMLAGDPLANLSLTNNAHADVLELVMGLGIPLLVTGGGGYHVDNTVRGWALAWSLLCGDSQGADDMSIGLGGVMLETTDWQGGLRDRMLVPDVARRSEVETALEETILKVRETVFPLHGL